VEVSWVSRKSLLAILCPWKNEGNTLDLSARLYYDPSIHRLMVVGDCKCYGSHHRRCAFTTRNLEMVFLH